MTQWELDRQMSKRGVPSKVKWEMKHSQLVTSVIIAVTSCGQLFCSLLPSESNGL